MKKSFLAEHRIILSKIIVIPIIILIFLCTPVITNLPFLNGAFELIGAFLAIIGVLGRVFSSVYMGNNRDKKVVTTGIYSITRNPLYFFSFIGGLGIVLAYGSIILTVLYLVIFTLYYRSVIKSEEKYLTTFFKQEYLDYLKKTPRFFPKFKLFNNPSEYITTSYKSVLKTIIDSSLILIIVVMIIILKNITPLKSLLYIW